MVSRKILGMVESVKKSAVTITLHLMVSSVIMVKSFHGNISINHPPARETGPQPLKYDRVCKKFQKGRVQPV